MKRGFSLIELLVVIGIVALLISLLLPVLGHVRDAAKLATCLGQHQQLQVAWSAVMIDTNRRIPVTNSHASSMKWDRLLVEKMDLPVRSGEPALACPTAVEVFGDLSNTQGQTTYAINTRWGVNTLAGANENKLLTQMPQPAAYPLLADGGAYQDIFPNVIYDVFAVPPAPDWRLGFIHADETVNVSWADGHATVESRDLVAGPVDDNGVPRVFFIDGGERFRTASQTPPMPRLSVLAQGWGQR